MHTFSFWRARRWDLYSERFLSDKSWSSRIKELMALMILEYSEISLVILSICVFTSANCLTLSSFLTLKSSISGVTNASCSFNDADFFSGCFCWVEKAWFRSISIHMMFVWLLKYWNGLIHISWCSDIEVEFFESFRRQPYIAKMMPNMRHKETACKLTVVEVAHRALV